MLVLSRKQGESICIAGNIVVRVIEISRSRIKLGFECPTSVRIHREELIRVEEEKNHAHSLACC